MKMKEILYCSKCETKIGYLPNNYDRDELFHIREIITCDRSVCNKT
jgi:hypothetical protein